MPSHKTKKYKPPSNPNQSHNLIGEGNHESYRVMKAKNKPHTTQTMAESICVMTKLINGRITEANLGH